MNFFDIILDSPSCKFFLTKNNIVFRLFNLMTRQSPFSIKWTVYWNFILHRWESFWFHSLKKQIINKRCLSIIMKRNRKTNPSDTKTRIFFGVIHYIRYIHPQLSYFYLVNLVHILPIILLKIFITKYFLRP
jgi:hypothetical protein